MTKTSEITNERNDDEHRPQGGCIVTAALSLADTQPAPVAVCSCGAQYDQRSFDALTPAAGHELDEMGQPFPVDGMTIRICGSCSSTVSVQEWAEERPRQTELSDVWGCVEPVSDGDPVDERERKEERAQDEDWQDDS
jgi:hypothetical protein